MELTKHQAKELKWFCDNCTGLRTEFYALREKFIAFKENLDRLEKTCTMINKFLDTHPLLDENVVLDKTPTPSKDVKDE